MQRTEAERLKTVILGGMKSQGTEWEVQGFTCTSCTHTAALAPLPGAVCKQFQLLEWVWEHLRVQKSCKSFTVKGFQVVIQVNVFLRGIVSNWSRYSSFCQVLVATSCNSAVPELKEDWEHGNNLTESLQGQGKVLALGRTYSKISFFQTTSSCTQSQGVGDAGGSRLGFGDKGRPVPKSHSMASKAVWAKEKSAEHIRWGLKNSNLQAQSMRTKQSCVHTSVICRPRCFSIKNSKFAVTPPTFYFHIFEACFNVSTIYTL